MGDTPLCVICRTRPVDPKWRPFCGERCQLLDLARWADGDYRVGSETPADDPEHENASDDND